ncbi:hypothetical protein Tco_1166775 [Tanacetum coccineum]
MRQSLKTKQYSLQSSSINFGGASTYSIGNSLIELVLHWTGSGYEMPSSYHLCYQYAMSKRLRAFTSFFLQKFSSAVEGTIIFNVVDGPDSGAVTGIATEDMRIRLAHSQDTSMINSVSALSSSPIRPYATAWSSVKDTKLNMDDPNITMEEYIRLEEEKARRCGKMFNWETAKYGKICMIRRSRI